MKNIENLTPAERLKEGAHYFIKGIANIGYALCSMINFSVKRYPYFYVLGILIVSVITSIVLIGEARSERDSLNKRNYELQKKLDAAQMVNEAREEQAHAYCIN